MNSKIRRRERSVCLESNTAMPQVDVEHLPSLDVRVIGERFLEAHLRKQNSTTNKPPTTNKIIIWTAGTPIFNLLSQRAYVFCEPLVNDFWVNRVNVPTRRRDASL